MDPTNPGAAPEPETGEEPTSAGDSPQGEEQRSSDTYSTGEAARILSRDPSQIRQWARSGRLNAVSRDPYRITQESVHRLRDELRGGARPGRHAGEAVSTSGHPVDVERLVASIVQQVMPRALEAQAAASDKVEGMLRDQLDEERHERRRAEQEASEAKARADQLAAELEQARNTRRRRWGRGEQ